MKCFSFTVQIHTEGSVNPWDRSEEGYVLGGTRARRTYTSRPIKGTGMDFYHAFNKYPVLHTHACITSIHLKGLTHGHAQTHMRVHIPYTNANTHNFYTLKTHKKKPSYRWDKHTSGETWPWPQSDDWRRQGLALWRTTSDARMLFLFPRTELVRQLGSVSLMWHVNVLWSQRGVTGCQSNIPCQGVKRGLKGKSLRHFIFKDQPLEWVGLCVCVL